MVQIIELHPDNPQPRGVKQVVEILRGGGVVAYPTELAYALGCCIGHKDALMRLRRARGLSEKHLLTLMCADISQMAEYAQIDNAAYRLIRGHLPGPFTFIFEATRAVPRRVMNPKRKTIGLRMASTSTVSAILAALGEPMITTTVKLGDDQGLPVADPYDIEDHLSAHLSALIIGAQALRAETTVVDLTAHEPVIVRTGEGELLV